MGLAKMLEICFDGSNPKRKEHAMPRITTGRFKNREIKALKGETTRPTLEKTRQTILNSLDSRFHLDDFQVLDLFAGSGAMALEAFSRGAGRMTLIERHPKAMAQLRENLASLGLEKEASLIQKDALEWLKTASFLRAPYLIFMDPPYGQGLWQEALKLLAKRKSELQGSILVIEHDPKEEFPIPEGFTLFLEKKQGAAKIEFLEID